MLLKIKTNSYSMKGKILVALKTKYKTFGFGDKAFDGVADYLSKTVTEESQIETAISGVEGLLKETLILLETKNRVYKNNWTN